MPRPCWKNWARALWTGFPTLMAPWMSPRCFPLRYPTCCSMAQPVLQWEWRLMSRRTTCGKLSLPPSACWSLQSRQSPSYVNTYRGRTTRRMQRLLRRGKTFWRCMKAAAAPCGCAHCGSERAPISLSTHCPTRFQVPRCWSR